MKTVIIVVGLLTVLTLSLGAIGMKAPKVRVAIEVKDEHRIPVDGAKVSVSFFDTGAHGYEDFELLTDGEGRVVIEAHILARLTFAVRKHGFYSTRMEIPVSKASSTANDCPSQMQEVILRSVKNPIPMHAKHEVTVVLPKLDEPIGFDLMILDLVEPYGQGKIADVSLTMTGEWIHRKNHHSILEAQFAGQKAGWLSFSAKSQTAFISPYEAPEDGEYSGRKQWRRSRLPDPDRPGKTVQMNDMRHDANYMFRIRTQLDDEGNVTNAYYGKIYGDVDFAGASSDGSYVAFETIYLNPTPNDRNLEFDPEQNLIKGLEPPHAVTQP